ncbi:tsr26 protein [Bacteroides sp. 4_1_36]|nr:tsr26 protein [Bacteroides sp. 4_1_36]
MNRNEITLQEMFSSVIGELREGGRWGTAHIYQSAVNAFSAFTKWQPMPMRKLSPTVLKRFENFLRQRNCSWNTVSTYIQDGTLGVSSGGGQKVHTVCTQTV